MRVFLFNIATDDLEGKKAGGETEEEDEQDDSINDQVGGGWEDEEEAAVVTHLSTPTRGTLNTRVDPGLSPIWGRPGVRVRDGVFLPEDANVRRRLASFQRAHNMMTT